MNSNYKKIIAHYENCLEKHGDNHLGVDWPKLEDVAKRYEVMLGILPKNHTASLLDFGCGTGHLLSYMFENGFEAISYAGLDISEKFIKVAKLKFPDIPFFCLDILESESELPNFDYIIMNGVFTEKRELSFDEMWTYFTNLITEVYGKCNKGFAFNVMSKNVDWERADLFHVSHDLLSAFLCKHLTRNYIIRNDYGLYEYTVYVLKK